MQTSANADKADKPEWSGVFTGTSLELERERF
jgi:hypothetical protein